MCCNNMLKQVKCDWRPLRVTSVCYTISERRYAALYMCSSAPVQIKTMFSACGSESLNLFNVIDKTHQNNFYRLKIDRIPFRTRGFLSPLCALVSLQFSFLVSLICAKYSPRQHLRSVSRPAHLGLCLGLPIQTRSAGLSAAADALSWFKRQQNLTAH